MIRWLCRFGWHRWPMWSEAVEVPVITRFANGDQLNNVIRRQSRTCAGCNLYQTRKVTVSE